MKKQFLIMPLMALFIYACTSSNESVDFIDENARNKSSISIPNIAEFINHASKMAHNKKSNDKGVMFFEQSGAFSNFIGFFDFPNLIFVYKLDETGFPAPLIDVKVYDDDKAQFSANVKNPYVEITDVMTGEIIYSNICDEEKIGHLHVNWTAPYNIIDFGFGPLYSPDNENVDESSTPNNLQLSVKANNAFKITNPETGEGDCNMPSSEINLRLINVDRVNTDRESSRLFKIIGL